MEPGAANARRSRCRPQQGIKLASGFQSEVLWYLPLCNWAALGRVRTEPHACIRCKGDKGVGAGALDWPVAGSRGHPHSAAPRGAPGSRPAGNYIGCSHGGPAIAPHGAGLVPCELAVRSPAGRGDVRGAARGQLCGRWASDGEIVALETQQCKSEARRQPSTFVEQTTLARGAVSLCGHADSC
jgi:hypothetical protein